MPAFDSVASAAINLASTVTWQHTVGGAANPAIIVFTADTDGNASVGTVTYAQTALSLITRAYSTAAGGNSARVEAWGLINPPSGTTNVVVQWASNAQGGCTSISYTGVGLINALSSATSAAADTHSPTLTVYSDPSETVVDYICANAHPTIGAGASQTTRDNYVGAGGGGSNHDPTQGCSEMVGAASTSPTWSLSTDSTNLRWAQVGIALQPTGRSIVTLYLNNPQQSNSSAGLLDTTAPTASTSTTGWTVGTTVAARFSRQTYNIEVPSGNFTSTAQPSGGPITTAGHSAEDCWRVSAVTSGYFSAGTWYSAVSVIAVTNASSQAGRGRFRLWRGTNADGSNAVELTQGTMIGTTTAALSTTVARSSSASTRIVASSVTNEYLFLQAAWETTTAATNVGADSLVRVGPLSDLGNGSFLVTSTFSSIPPAGAATGGGGGYWMRVQDWMLA